MSLIVTMKDTSDTTKQFHRHMSNYIIPIPYRLICPNFGSNRINVQDTARGDL